MPQLLNIQILSDSGLFLVIAQKFWYCNHKLDTDIKIWFTYLLDQHRNSLTFPFLLTLSKWDIFKLTLFQIHTFFALNINSSTYTFFVLRAKRLGSRVRGRSVFIFLISESFMYVVIVDCILIYEMFAYVCHNERVKIPMPLSNIYVIFYLWIKDNHLLHIISWCSLG